MVRQHPDQVARQAWDWLSDAETAYRKAQDYSPEQMAAIQAMASAALTAMKAEELDGRYK